MLADESGITVHIAERDEPIVPASRMSNIKNFIDSLAILLIVMEVDIKLLIINNMGARICNYIY